MNKTLPRLVFLHVPRTGGTTLHHHLSAHFAPEQICPERFSRLERYSESQLEQWRFFSGHFNAEEIRRIPGPIFVVTVLRNPVERLLSNYYFWKRHRPQTITRHKLRGPALAREGDLAHFLGIREAGVLDSTNNMVARRYAGNVYAWPDGSWCARSGNKGHVISDLELVHRALGNLLTFDLVGDISKLHAIYSHLAEIFGMAPLKKIERLNSRDIIDEKLDAIEEEPITPEVKKAIGEFTRLDRMVYRLARTHFKTKQPSFKM